MVTKCFQNYSVFNSKFCKGRLHINEIHKEDNVDSVDNNVDNVDNRNNINADIDTEKSRYRIFGGWQYKMCIFLRCTFSRSLKMNPAFTNCFV